MSHGAGHILDMINRMKQNRALRPTNRQKFKGNNRGILNSESNNETEKPIFKTVPEKELIEIKEGIRNQTKKREDCLWYVFYCIYYFRD
tara:strand:- start:218 stop:484 length:267 start_codon:yes stop_codon:yes gene_type:complete